MEIVRPFADLYSNGQMNLLRTLASSGRRPNCLFVCSAGMIPAICRAAGSLAAAPVTYCALPGKLTLPEQTGGTLVVADAAALRMHQQIELFDWLSRRRGVQVMTFSTADLAAMALDGRFLEGLYYRLNVVRVDVTPCN